MATNGNGALTRNVRRLSHLDLPGGGQVVVQGDYAYVGHMKPPHGTSIIDVSDPKNPKLVTTIMLEDDRSHSHKVRVVGDVMTVNVEQNNRHFQRLGDRLPELRAALQDRLGHPPSDAELAAELKFDEADIAVLNAARERGYGDGGFKLYDISDKTNPRQIAYRRTHGFGTHRFDVDADYAYISTEMEGYIGNILVTYDIRDPETPEEVSRWWIPGQHIAGGETPSWRGYRNRLHHALRQGDQLWAAVWHAGFRVVDVADIANPTTVAEYNYHPPFPEPTHTILPMPFEVAGRRVAVVVDEEHEYRYGRGHANLWVFDVTDLADIQPLSMFHVAEADSPWSGAPGRFGAHQFQEHFEDTLVYVTWFSGGLRIVDIADPLEPVEVGHFIPEPVQGEPSPQSNDVEVDDRGLIYLIDRKVGFDILVLER
jgi:hypothetical protein